MYVLCCVCLRARERERERMRKCVKNINPSFNSYESIKLISCINTGQDLDRPPLSVAVDVENCDKATLLM